MPISFACPGCGNNLKVADEAAGKRGTCPQCRSSVLVPIPALAGLVTDEDDPPPQEPKPTVEPQPRPTVAPATRVVIVDVDMTLDSMIRFVTKWLLAVAMVLFMFAACAFMAVGLLVAIVALFQYLF